MCSNFQRTQRVKWVGVQFGSSSTPPYVQGDKPSAAAQGKVNTQEQNILGCHERVTVTCVAGSDVSKRARELMFLLRNYVAFWLETSSNI